YRVEKVSSFGGLSNNSVVLENNRVYFWSEDGIYTVGRNDLGDTTVDSITIGSIQRIYDEIPNLYKTKAEGIYDNITKKVKWIFNYSDPYTENDETRELVLDTTLGAFSINKIMNISPNTVT